MDPLEFWVKGVLIAFVGIFGLIGNIIAVCVLMKPNLKSATDRILLALAINNAVYVFTKIIYKSVPVLFDMNSKTFYIKLFASPVSHVAYTTSMILTVLLALERYLQVCHPQKAKKTCTLKNAKICTVFATPLGLFTRFPDFSEENWNLMLVISDMK